MSDMSVNASMASGVMASSLHQQAMGAQLIDKTLHKMHETAGTVMAPRLDSNFEMQTSVLGAAYMGKGTAVDLSI